jgi:DtxR family transcriptional regulator, Mn-dependent transcriptional regulator
MERLTASEGKYLKAIYTLSGEGKQSVATNSIAGLMGTKAASVSDMLGKLAEKEMISYKKYYGVNLTEKGHKTALTILRRHRLWEVFLVDKLRFQWEAIPDIADELEQLDHPLLIRKLDEYLGYSKFDPYGDPIPDEFGDIQTKARVPLQDMPLEMTGKIAAVKDNSAAFLRYLDKMGLYIGARMAVLEKVEFDGSLELMIDNQRKVFVSREVASNILVQPL